MQGRGRAVWPAPPSPAPAEQRLDLTEGRHRAAQGPGGAGGPRARQQLLAAPSRVDVPVLTLPVTLDFTPPRSRYWGARAIWPGAAEARRAARPRHLARGRSTRAAFLSRRPRRRRGHRRHGGCSRSPWDLPAGATVSVLAQDEAGNTVTRGWRRRSSRSASHGHHRAEGGLSPAEGGGAPARESRRVIIIPAFLGINRDQRKAANRPSASSPPAASRVPCGKAPSPASAQYQVFSNFAETLVPLRGARGGRQVHLGFDLASASRPVPAANAGVVVFAAPLTIYGNTVVLDHGWGLQTLTSFEVKATP